MNMKVPDLSDAEISLLCAVINRAPGEGRPLAMRSQLPFFQWPWVEETAFDVALKSVKPEFQLELEVLLAKMREANK